MRVLLFLLIFSNNANALVVYNVYQMCANHIPCWKPVDLSQSGGVTNQLPFALLSGVPAQTNSDWNAVSGSAQIINKPTLFSGSYSSLTGIPSFSTVATSGSYLDLSNKPSIPTVPISSVFGRIGSVIAATGDYTTSLVTEVANLYFTTARVLSTTLSGFSSTTGTVSSSDSILQSLQKIVGNLALKYGSVVYNCTAPTRALNTNFTPSSTVRTDVCYSIDTTCALTLAGTCTSSVELRSDTSTTPTTARAKIGNTLTLGVGVVVGTTVGGPQELCFSVPPTWNVRLVSAGTTPTITTQSECTTTFGP